jgi:hypothetical protein
MIRWAKAFCAKPRPRTFGAGAIVRTAGVIVRDARAESAGQARLPNPELIAVEFRTASDAFQAMPIERLSSTNQEEPDRSLWVGKGACPRCLSPGSNRINPPFSLEEPPPTVYTPFAFAILAKAPRQPTSGFSTPFPVSAKPWRLLPLSVPHWSLCSSLRRRGSSALPSGWGKF